MENIKKSSIENAYTFLSLINNSIIDKKPISLNKIILQNKFNVYLQTVLKKRNILKAVEKVGFETIYKWNINYPIDNDFFKKYSILLVQDCNEYSRQNAKKRKLINTNENKIEKAIVKNIKKCSEIIENDYIYFTISVLRVIKKFDFSKNIVFKHSNFKINCHKILIEEKDDCLILNLCTSFSQIAEIKLEKKKVYKVFIKENQQEILFSIE